MKTLEQAAMDAAQEIWADKGLNAVQIKGIILHHIKQARHINDGLVRLYAREIRRQEGDINSLRERVTGLEFRLAELEGRPMLRFEENEPEGKGLNK